MKKLALVFGIVVSLGIITACVDEELMIEETVVTCDSIDAEYNKLIIDLALSNGWDPKSYTFNSTTIGDGFLDPFYDPNFKIFIEAYTTYQADWIAAVVKNGCN